VSGLKAWLRSDAGVEADSAGRVAAWRDQSGQSNDLTQGVLLRRPVLGPSAMNGLPVLHFDGTNDWLAFPSNLSSVFTVFAVLREDADATGRRALLGEDGWYFSTALFPASPRCGIPRTPDTRSSTARPGSTAWPWTGLSHRVRSRCRCCPW
jgi:hypothetical protein